MAATRRSWVVAAFVGVLFSVVVVWGFPCTEDYCVQKVKCVEFNKTDCDLVLESATVCGCCSTCITYLKEGDGCIPIDRNEFGAMGKLHHCGPQLQCIKRECRKKKTDCLDELQEYQKLREVYGWLNLGKIKPVCDEYGDYYRKQCRPGSLCYCVSRKGERIFGHTSDKVPLDIGCECSRQFDELQSVIGKSSLGKWMQDPSQRLDHFLRCMDNGDYDSLQCVDNKCFCLNDTMQVKAEVNSFSGFRNLSCYNPVYHEETFYRPCEREYKWKMDQKDYLESQRQTIVIGMDFPTCTLDGTYGPKQCRLNECFCARKDGNKIAARYTTSRHDAAMNECNCAREFVFLQEHRLTKKVSCDYAGNYNRKQCLGAHCYCVDPIKGHQTEIEFDPLDGKEHCTA